MQLKGTQTLQIKLTLSHIYSYKALHIKFDFTHLQLGRIHTEHRMNLNPARKHS